jgi:hypothetical protein
MQFRIEYTTRELYLDDRETDPLVFKFGQRKPVTVILHRVREEDIQAAGYQKDDSFCTVILEREPNDAVHELFKSSPPSRWFVASDDLPENFWSFSHEIGRTAHDYAVRTIRTLRWRQGTPGHHNPIRSAKGPEWSFDGQTWAPLPGRGSVEIGATRMLRAPEDIRKEVERHVNRGLSEPLAHEMFREAWWQRGENPRSALILGIASAEIGLKQFIIGQQPTAQWLVENLPAPPITTIIREYLPTIALSNQAVGPVIIPKGIADEIERGVKMRNDLVHGRPMTLSRLRQLLDSIEDFLWLLDYYSGYQWAINHVSHDTRQVLPIG